MPAVAAGGVGSPLGTAAAELLQPPCIAANGPSAEWSGDAAGAAAAYPKVIRE